MRRARRKTTTASAISASGTTMGARTARITVKKASASSISDTTGLPSPPVVAVEVTRAPVWAALKARAAGAPTISPATAAMAGSTAQNTLPAATAPATGRVT